MKWRKAHVLIPLTVLLLAVGSSSTQEPAAHQQPTVEAQRLAQERARLQKGQTALSGDAGNPTTLILMSDTRAMDSQLLAADGSRLAAGSCLRALHTLVRENETPSMERAAD
eukprot:scaffold8027_cov417-Prasinococcus_capsulatus_cf.AAC.1